MCKSFHPTLAFNGKTYSVELAEVAKAEKAAQEAVKAAEGKAAAEAPKPEAPADNTPDGPLDSCLFAAPGAPDPAAPPADATGGAVTDPSMGTKL